jgi:hypothetical protein
MNTITNPFASHMTAQQHAKLAQHYHNRHFQIACTQIIRKRPARHVLIDYGTIYAKYLYHKQAAAALRAIEAQRRTEAGLLALGTVAVETCDECGFADCQCGQYEAEDAGWCKHCNTEEGRGNCMACMLERQQQQLDAPVVRPTVEANVQAGKTYYRHGDTPDTAFTVLGINPERQRNSICAYRVAQVRLLNGDVVEYKLSGNQRYVEVL